MTAESVLTKHQKKTSISRRITYGGEEAVIVAEMRFDDECGNGHNTFSITGTIRSTRKNARDHGFMAGGCLHEEIAKHFPNLAPYIKWHLCSTDGPMHYLANTTYLAGDKDHNGQRAGEPSRFEHGIRFGDSPVTHHIGGKLWAFLKERQGTGDFQVVEHEHGRSDYKFRPKYSFVGFGEKWHECPFDSRVEADEWAEGMKRCKVEFVKLAVDFSQGKPRELDAARHAAIWPAATDEELTAPGLKERLEARLPALLEAFKADMETLGFKW